MTWYKIHQFHFLFSGQFHVITGKSNVLIAAATPRHRGHNHRFTQTEILLWQPYTLRSKHMNSYIIYMINNYITQSEILLWQPYTLRSKHMNSYIIDMTNNYITTNLILTSAIAKKLYLYRKPKKY